MNAKYASVPRQVRVWAKYELKKGLLTIQCDEWWSFVKHKGNKQRVWLAMNAKIREIVGVRIGDRSETEANALAMCNVLHQHLGSLCGSLTRSETSSCGQRKWIDQSDWAIQLHLMPKRIERFNCTWCQSVFRLVRKTLSFSRELDNHVGAIWYFIHHSNASLPS